MVCGGFYGRSTSLTPGQVKDSLFDVSTPSRSIRTADSLLETSHSSPDSTPQSINKPRNDYISHQLHNIFKVCNQQRQENKVLKE